MDSNTPYLEEKVKNLELQMKIKNLEDENRRLKEDVQILKNRRSFLLFAASFLLLYRFYGSSLHCQTALDKAVPRFY